MHPGGAPGISAQALAHAKVAACLEAHITELQKAGKLGAQIEGVVKTAGLKNASVAIAGNPVLTQMIMKVCRIETLHMHSLHALQALFRHPTQNTFICT